MVDTTLSEKPLIAPGRECGTCTACCEGWLIGEVRGMRFYPGMPCHFKGQGCCTIYADRPKKQCQDFHCLWLIDQRIPAWFRPDKTKVLLTNVRGEQYDYIQAYETGEKIDAVVLNRLLQHAMQHELNLMYQVNGGWNAIGSSQFLAEYSGMYHIPDTQTVENTE